MTTGSRGSHDVTLLLLSGGLDSTALAAWLQPDLTLFVDYGQRPAVAEGRAAAAVSAELGIRHAQVRVDASAVGCGLLLSADRAVGEIGHKSPEWWPFRNQLLVTIAGAWLLREYPSRASATELESEWTIVFGAVESDGDRHLDGTVEFFQTVDTLLSNQEGRLRCRAPASTMTTEQLLGRHPVSDAVLGWTHSCHTSNHPCADCPGCWKRQSVLDSAGRLR
jgi:7-cyano-7-deazaguanine synthase